MRAIIDQEDTIAAISTPLGEGGIGIVRLSGKDSLKIADKIFKGKNGVTPSCFSTFTVHYGYIVDKRNSSSGNGNHQKKIDEVILTVMRAPRTYTKEDIVEINCHGGIVALKKILELLLVSGARLAQPGEFTQRAFLNGRIDLAQAEAVLDIVKAKTDVALKLAMHQLQGALSNRINKLREKLIELIAPFEATIDFPDEEIDIPSLGNTVRLLEDIATQIKDFIDSADKGIILQNGINIVIVGSPNVGKSSLMNRLLEYERVIVTPISGTTRDVIEEMFNIDGLPIRLADTAGIGNSQTLITKESVKRSLSFLEKADLGLLVLDVSRKLNSFDLRVARLLKNRRALIIVNKIDLPEKIDLASLKKILPKVPLIKICALKGLGIDKVKKKIFELFFQGKVWKNDEIVINNVRHKKILENCYQNIRSAISLIKAKENIECFVFEIRQAFSELAEIVGEDLSADILNNIFSRFCIGK